MKKSVAKYFLVALVLTMHICSSETKYGLILDQQLQNETIWWCLKDNGCEFAIIKMFDSDGTIDEGTITTLRTGGLKVAVHYMDVYGTPCQKCGDPSGQARRIGETLRKFLHYIAPTIWIKMDKSEWSDSAADNVKFLREFIRALPVYPKGFYTNASQWRLITNDAKQDDFEQLPFLHLWYANHDNKTDFGDFEPFASWKEPRVKEYAGREDICGVNVYGKAWRNE